MGLGAGFHIRDFVEKEKEKLKEKVKDPDYVAKQKDRAEFHKRSSTDSINVETPGASYGWTGMIEDWLCSGNPSGNPSPSPGGETPPLQVNGKPISNDNTSPSLHEKKHKAKGREYANTPLPAGLLKDLSPAYQLIMKERMMGLYMAVFIHRDIRHLVEGNYDFNPGELDDPLNQSKGTSRDAVAAGLIGGRVGNKGGVGIGMKIDGTTFLFINAHLAG
jgi:hypothetical protein